MDLLIDTHVLLWLVEGERISRAAREAIEGPDTKLSLSVVTAWEFVDLQQRRRLPTQAQLQAILARLRMSVLPLPETIWNFASHLPNLHGDPVDRMLIAHAIHADLTLITADETIRRYPVRTLW